MRFPKRLRLLVIAGAILLLLSAAFGGLYGETALAAGKGRYEGYRSLPTTISQQEDSESPLPYPVMRPSPKTLKEWIDSRNGLPQADISPFDRYMVMQYSKSGQVTSFSLLDHLDYIPEERDQGRCGNCWVWGSTGAMEIALDVQHGIKDRLSIQYFDSNYSRDGGWACDGGTIPWFADFYSETGMAVPWSNTNAYYQDGDGGSSDGSNVPADDISTVPSYPITSIEAKRIPTWKAGEQTAINNIKAVLHQGSAVPFCFYMPEREDWIILFDFWDEKPETAIWNPDYSCGKEMTDGGGHEVLCVGYNDAPGVDNDYWVMLNSWSTANGGRPNGLFRVDMHMDYDGQFGSDGEWQHSFEWWTLDITFDVDGIYYFEDPQKESELYIYSDYDIFRFTSPEGYDSGPVQANYMKVTEFRNRLSICINHRSESMVLVAVTMPSAPDSCFAFVIDRERHRIMRMVDPPGIE